MELKLREIEIDRGVAGVDLIALKRKLDNSACNGASCNTAVSMGGKYVVAPVVEGRIRIRISRE